MEKINFNKKNEKIIVKKIEMGHMSQNKGPVCIPNLFKLIIIQLQNNVLKGLHYHGFFFFNRQLDKVIKSTKLRNLTGHLQSLGS